MKTRALQRNTRVRALRDVKHVRNYTQRVYAVYKRISSHFGLKNRMDIALWRVEAFLHAPGNAPAHATRQIA
jgi:hypothetical protein